MQFESEVDYRESCYFRKFEPQERFINHMKKLSVTRGYIEKAVKIGTVFVFTKLQFY
jgi:hypothetical protein